MNGQIKHAVSKVTYTKVGSEYRVVNALGQVSMLSTIDFLELYSPVATVVEPTKINPQFYEEGNLETPFDNDPVSKAALETEIDKIRVNVNDLESMYPSKDVDSMRLAYVQNLNDTESGPVNSFKKEMRKHLEPNTIANLIQSNLDNRPDGDSISRTMLGRIGRNEPRQ